MSMESSYEVPMAQVVALSQETWLCTSAEGALGLGNASENDLSDFEFGIL